jgi:hypothetical protein
MATLAGCDELVESLEPIPPVEVLPADVRGCRESDLGALIYDTVGAWFRSLTPEDDRVELLGEAFYSIACDYNLARHLTWPWCRGGAGGRELFLPYFELWRRGADVCFLDDGACRLLTRAPARP